MPVSTRSSAASSSVTRRSTRLSSSIAGGEDSSLPIRYEIKVETNEPVRITRSTKRKSSTVGGIVAESERERERRRAPKRRKVENLKPVTDANLPPIRTSTETDPTCSLDDREKALIERERCLEERCQSVSTREQQLSFALSQIDNQLAKEIFSQIEMNFTCSMCYEVMACPQTLPPINCGHTFCALCILKWYFSKLHGCGSWHDAVDCPLCRCKLPSAALPRYMQSFPCIPVRQTEQALAGLLERLASLGDANDATALDWRLDGVMRLDWEMRTHEGGKLIARLKNGWQHMDGPELLAIQRHLGSNP